MWQRFFLIGLAIILLMVRPIAASDITSAKTAITNLIADNDGLAMLFAEQTIAPIGQDKAYIFVEKDAIRYAIIAVPIKTQINMSQAAEQLCRSRLMTPEAEQVRMSLIAKTDDNRLIKTVLSMWQSSGQVKDAQTTTYKRPDDGAIISICKAASDNISIDFYDVSPAILARAEMMIARQLYDNAAYDNLQSRMQNYINENYTSDAKAYLALAYIKQKQYDEAFALDEELDHSAILDQWLQAEYQARLDQAIDAYFTTSLKSN